MGGCLDIRTYDKKLSEAQVEEQFSSDQDSDAYENGHSYSGSIGVMPHGVTWRSETCKTIREAEDFISENHDKWDEAFAVRTEEGYVVGGWCSS